MPNRSTVGGFVSKLKDLLLRPVLLDPWSCNPLGYTNSVSVGVLSGTGRSVGNGGYEMLQTDAPVNHGSNGGPMFDRKGIMIGMVTLKEVASSAEGLGFAISTAAIEQALDVDRRDQMRNYLGEIVSEGLAVSLGAKSAAGLAI